MKTLILLAGLHKTGSTSVQQTCVRNRQALGAQGLLYFPELLANRRFAVDATGNHTRLLRIAFGQALRNEYERGGHERIRPAVIRAMRQMLEQGPATVLMSAEGVSAFKPAEIEALKQWFQEAGFGIRMLCCVRKPSEWLASMVAQRVAGEAGPRLTIGAAVQEFVQAGGIIVPRFRILQDAFPETDFYSFDEARQHPQGPPGFFLERIGLQSVGTLEMVRANEGKSAHTVRLLSLVNGRMGPRAESRRHNAFHKAIVADHPALFAIPGEKFTLRADEMEPLRGLLEEENRWLEDRFGAGFGGGQVRLDAAAPALDDSQRALLRRELQSAEGPVRDAIAEYLEAVSA